MGNALVARRALMALPGPFDERYNFTGGEDGDVFARLIDAGCRFIAVDSAIVYEHLTPRRTTMRWLLKRRVRTGIDKSRLARSRTAGAVAPLAERGLAAQGRSGRARRAAPVSGGARFGLRRLLLCSAAHRPRRCS